MDERATTVGEGQYEHTSQPTPSLVCSSPLYFSYNLFSRLIFSFFQASLRSAFQIEAEMDLSLDLSFLNHITPTPQSSMRLPSDSNVVASRFTMSQFHYLDLFFLSTSQKDAFYATLAVLSSNFRVTQSKIFILEALAQTSYVFPTLYHALKSNMEISSKLDALKRQNTKFEQA